MRVAASFWEEHCCECGMPLCYGTCRMFERGWHGRCVRVDGFRESILGAGRVRFRRWGKIEAVWHGTMVSPPAAACAERANRALAPAYRILGPLHRAIRWRLLSAVGRACAPTDWRIRARSRKDERLVAAVAYEDGREVLRRALDLRAGVERTFLMPLPAVEKGALFRIFPADGEATGEIDMIENVVGRDMGAPHVKCLAWDLDGTLWSGTLAEDGVEGCSPKPESLALLKELNRRGVVNSVVSRNDAGAAAEALRRMGLEEQFVFPQFGWGPKSEGVRNLAKELNVSLDAIAFVDDRGEQLAEVAANAPGVRVYDAREIPRLAGREEFCPPPSAESGLRRARYRDEMLRRRDLSESFGGDEEAFSAASGLSYGFLPVEGDVADRCFELVNRTNQLNISGRRYSRDDFARLVESCETRAVRAWDRYGDYGTVGFVASKGRRLVELCFSCRVAHKGLERRVLADVAGGERLSADVRRTERNAPIRAILEEFL